MRTFFTLFLACVTVFSGSRLALAEDRIGGIGMGEGGGSPKLEPHAQVELISDASALVPGKTFRVGVHFRLDPHWHVYWVNPGDAGLPVSVSWTLPAGFSAGPILWPYPERIEAGPLVNYGYAGDLLLPIDVAATTTLPTGGKIEIKAKAKWVICKDICLPGGQDLTLSLPVATGVTSELPSGPNAELFRAAQSRLPLSQSPWSFSAIEADSSLFLIAQGPSGGVLSGFQFFPETPDRVQNAPPQLFYPIAGGFALELRRVLPDSDRAGASGSAPTLKGVAVSSTGWNTPGLEKSLSVEVTPVKGARPQPLSPPRAMHETSAGTPQAQLRPASGSVGSVSASGIADSGSVFKKLIFMLSLAFLGGLILNLMPCVLPVLSLKIFDFVKRAGESRWKVFSHGLIFTAGVLISFWILAGLLLILRRGGQELGWGFQLQSPTFLVVLCALFFFFSLNLFGVFELGYLFTRVGAVGPKHGFAASFLAGVTATVVATPCTAPFMGTAMGYAFTQPAYFAMLVFTFLGLGMASPYLILSGFPSLMQFLPKPGEWMEHLKQFMGFPLLATAIWLAWVLGKQAGVDALAALLVVLLLAGISAWVLGKWTALHRSTPVRVIAGLVALAVFFPAFILVLIYLGQSKTNGVARPGWQSMGQGVGAPTEGGIPWQPFSDSALQALTAAGKPVFVDFTADWCLSCKVNERVAFSSQDVAKKFRELGLAMLKADWTSRDESIARALARYGRNSIPLYVLYGGKGPEDFILLPEVLTPGIVLQALERLVPPATTMR